MYNGQGVQITVNNYYSSTRDTGSSATTEGRTSFSQMLV
jgi:hypothetical protein